VEPVFSSCQCTSTKAKQHSQPSNCYGIPGSIYSLAIQTTVSQALQFLVYLLSWPSQHNWTRRISMITSAQIKSTQDQPCPSDLFGNGLFCTTFEGILNKKNDNDACGFGTCFFFSQCHLELEPHTTCNSDYDVLVVHIFGQHDLCS
jgi:hypothetical protein